MGGPVLPGERMPPKGEGDLEEMLLALQVQVSACRLWALVIANGLAPDDDLRHELEAFARILMGDE